MTTSVEAGGSPSVGTPAWPRGPARRTVLALAPPALFA
jgi:hypothetical protein